MAAYFADRCMYYKAERSLEYARKFYKAVTNHKRYRDCKEDIDVILIGEGHNDVIVA